YVQDLRRIYPAKTADELLATLRREVADMANRPVPQAIPVPVRENPPRPAPGPEPSIYKFRDDVQDRSRRAEALPPTLPPGSYVPPRNAVAEEDEMPAGSWLAALLFGVVLTGGLLLLGYVLV